MKKSEASRGCAVALCLAVLACGESGAPAPADTEVEGTQPASLERSVEASALASVLDEPDRFVRAERLAALLARPDDVPLPEVKALIQRFRVEESVAEFGLLFRYWAEHEPAEAADWSLQRGNARFRQAAVHTAFEAWAERDPAAAVLGVRRASIEPEEISRVAQMALVAGWFTRDRDELLEYIRTQGIGVERQRAIFAYALSLASIEGVDAAREWAESLPDDDERFKIAAFRQVMNALTTLDLAAAVAWCDEQCDSKWGRSLRKPLMRSRLRRGDDPVEILEWVAGMDASTPKNAEERTLSLQVTYATWANTRKQEAMDWLEASLASGEAPEWLPSLYRYYATLKASISPEDAIAFVDEHIEDPEEREKALIGVAQMWKSNDPAAAEAWLETSPLSESARLQAQRFKPPS